MLASDMYGLLGFCYDAHRLLVKDLDPLPVDLIVGFGLVFPDCGCCFVFWCRTVSYDEAPVTIPT